MEIRLDRLGKYEPPARPWPRMATNELLVGVARAEERARREGHLEAEALAVARELLSDLTGLPPAMS